MKQLIFALIGFILLASLQSCTKCEEKTVTCHVIPTGLQTAFKENKVGDSLKFKDDSGNNIIFVIGKSEVAPYTVLDCLGPDGLGGCSCPTCEDFSKGEILSNTDSKLYPNDSSRQIYFDDYNYMISGNPENFNNSAFIGITFLNIAGYRIYLQDSKLSDKQIYHDFLRLNDETYFHVYHCLIDSNNYYNHPKQYISELIVARDVGLIGFKDKIRNSFFYLHK